MSVAPTVAELPLQDIRFLFGTTPQLRMLPDKLVQSGNVGIGEFKLVAHFPAASANTEADKKAYLQRHATFQGGDYSIYYDGTYSLDDINWDATNRAGVHLITQDKYGNTVQFPVVPSKSVPGDLKLLVSEYVESILNPPLMVRCSGIGGRLTPDPTALNTFDLSVNPQQTKCPVKARPHVPQQYHAEEMTMDHGRYVIDASALSDSEIQYLDFYLYGAEETFNSPYAGSGALSGVGLSTNQLTSTVGSGTFDQASLNSSGHMNVFANAEDEDEDEDFEYPCDICGKAADYNFQDSMIRWKIVDDDFDPSSAMYAGWSGSSQNDFYCKECAKKEEGDDYYAFAHHADPHNAENTYISKKMREVHFGQILTEPLYRQMLGTRSNYPGNGDYDEYFNEWAHLKQEIDATEGEGEWDFGFEAWKAHLDEKFTEAGVFERTVPLPKNNSKTDLQITIPADVVERITTHFGITKENLTGIINNAIKDELETTAGYDTSSPIYQKLFQTDLSNIRLDSEEEGNTPVQDPMEFGEMANWTPLDGTPGLKRKRAENYY